MPREPASRMMPERLRTATLSLRPFRDGDAPAVYAYWKSGPDWERFNASVPPGFSEDDAEAFVAEMRQRDRQAKPSWALLHQGTVVGVVSLVFEAGHRSAVLGYGIHARLRGRGLCGEAARCVVSVAFAAHRELQTILAHTDADNDASIRVLEKLGFSRERSDPHGVEKSAGGPTFCLSRADWGVHAGP